MALKCEGTVYMEEEVRKEGKEREERRVKRERVEWKEKGDE